MVGDVSVVKNHIKPKADSTLYNMRKVDLIEYIRTLEHNYNVAVSFNENQARYIESLDVTKVVHGWWEKGNKANWQMPMCSVCQKQATSRYDYCPNCGAKMDGGRKCL